MSDLDFGFSTVDAAAVESGVDLALSEAKGVVDEAVAPKDERTFENTMMPLDRMADVILIPEGEQARTFDLLVCMDREYPMPTAAGRGSPGTSIGTCAVSQGLATVPEGRCQSCLRPPFRPSFRLHSRGCDQADRRRADPTGHHRSP